MARQVKCLYCGENFDRDKERHGKVGNRYAHEKCIVEHEKNEEAAEKIHEKMKRLLGVSYSKVKIDRQLKELFKTGKTGLGILNTLDYWYDVRQSDPAKANGGIGIVEYIYGEAQDYWYRQEQNKTRYKNVNCEDFLIKEKESYIVYPTPIKAPKRVKIFEIR